MRGRETEGRGYRFVTKVCEVFLGFTRSDIELLFSLGFVHCRTDFNIDGGLISLNQIFKLIKDKSYCVNNV